MDCFEGEGNLDFFWKDCTKSASVIIVSYARTTESFGLALIAICKELCEGNCLVLGIRFEMWCCAVLESCRVWGKLEEV